MVGVLAAIPALVVMAITGPFETPDSGGYLYYAKLLATGPLPSGEALLNAGYSPIPLYRIIGYPAVIASTQYLAPGNWPYLLLALQISAQSFLAVYSYRVALALGLKPLLAFLAALMPTVGSVAVFQSAIMTDALFGALYGGAMLVLMRASLPDVVRGQIRNLSLAGVLLGIAATIREATPFLIVGLLPAAFIVAGKGRRILGLVALVGPTLLVAALLMADHYRRSGHAVLSTSKQIVMVQALLPLIARGVPVFEGEELFDRLARETITNNDYFGVHRLNAKLHAEGMTAPEIAREASVRYARAWRQYPLEMIRASIARLPIKMLWITFMPVDTAADVYRQTGEPRPWFGRPEMLWSAFMNGSISAFIIWALLMVGRFIGLAVMLGAIFAPLALTSFDRRRTAMTTAWLASGVFVGVYLPVHLEQRYLIPIVPVLCLLGVVAWQTAIARWVLPQRSDAS